MFPVHLDSVERNHGVKNMWNLSCYLSSMTCEPHTKLWGGNFPSGLPSPQYLTVAIIYLQQHAGLTRMLELSKPWQSLQTKILSSETLHSVDYPTYFQHHYWSSHFSSKTWVTWFVHLQSFSFHSLPEFFLLA